MRETRWKCIFRAKFLAQGFVVRALMPQGWVGSPNHSVFVNNLLVSLIYCERLKEIGEMACVTPARSSRGQTYRSSFQGTISYFSFRTQWLANDTAPPTFFYVLWIELFEENPKKFHFHQPWLVLALLLPNDMVESFPRFPLLCLLSVRSCSFNVTQLLSCCAGPLCYEMVVFLF